MPLRWYQTEAIKAVYAHLEDRDDNPCVVMPTGSGKSHVIAQIARDVTLKWHGRALILAHRKELLEQNLTKLRDCDPRGHLDMGMYSAGLKRRDTDSPVIFAGIQSVYSKPGLLGSFNIVMVDEAHLIPPDGEGMYRTLLASLDRINPGVRVIGFTATPFRTKIGPLCTKDGILNHVCYEAPLPALISQGHLTRLVSYAGGEEAKIDTIDVAVCGGEFVKGQLELKAMVDGRVAAAVNDIVRRTKNRQKVLIFTCSVNHCETVTLELNYQSHKGSQHIIGTTPAATRDYTLEEFRNGRFKYLVNVDVFTEGLDVPDIDTIVLLRPTKSPGLYVQMVGRGFRVAPGKLDCLVLDYGDNVLRHGPVDQVRARSPSGRKGEAPAKECPSCKMIVPAGVRECPGCGHEFPKPEAVHNRVAGTAAIMGSEASWVTVDRIDYEVHTKWGAPADAPKTVRVDYINGLCYRVSEWICVEHDGFARVNAMKWWGKRQKDFKRIPCPTNARYAVEILESGAMREAGRILVKTMYGRRNYDQILDYEMRLNDGTLVSDYQVPNTLPDDEVPF